MRAIGLWLLFIVLTQVSCRSSKPAIEFYAPMAEQSNYVASKILFLTISFAETEQGVVSEIKEVIEAEGELKRKNPYQRNSESRYVLQLIGGNREVVSELFVQDPFHKHMDVFTPSGEIKKGHVHQENVSENYRIQYPENWGGDIVLFEILNENIKYITTLRYE